MYVPSTILLKSHPLLHEAFPFCTNRSFPAAASGNQIFPGYSHGFCRHLRGKNKNKKSRGISLPPFQQLARSKQRQLFGPYIQQLKQRVASSHPACQEKRQAQTLCLDHLVNKIPLQLTDVKSVQRKCFLFSFYVNVGKVCPCTQHLYTLMGSVPLYVYR